MNSCEIFPLDPQKSIQMANFLEIFILLQNTCVSTLNLNLKETYRDFNFDNFEISSGFVITLSFRKTNLYWSNKVV